MKNNAIILCIAFLVFACMYQMNASSPLSAMTSPVELREKADRVRDLLRAKKERGEDVAESEKKYRRSVTAFRSRDMDTADRLVEELLRELSGPVTKADASPEKKDARTSGIEETKNKSVRLNLPLKAAYMVSLKPRYQKGKEITSPDGEGAFDVAPLALKDGAVTVPLTAQPVFILEEQPRLPLTPARLSESSPFGLHPAKVEDIENPYQYATDIGVSWHRPAKYFAWILVQTDIAKSAYDWSLFDSEIRQVPPGMNLLYNIIVAPPASSHQKDIFEKAKKKGLDLEKYIRKDSYLPVNNKAYTAFVTACVERYDGDGIDDMPGLTSPIKYWQVGNEPHPKIADFAEFVKITSSAIRQADPSAKVVLGGAFRIVMESRSNFERAFIPVIKELQGKYIDIIDFHWGSNAQGNYRDYKDIYSYLRSELVKAGLSGDTPVWITEMSTYSGDPVKASSQPWDPPYQSEGMQAGDLIKRYVYGLSIGVEKIFWAWGLMEGFHGNDTYFDHTGLMYDGKFSSDEGRGVKKLSYYSYKLMTSLLDGSDWKRVETVVDGKDNIYVYRFTKKESGAKVYVVWWDYFRE